MASCDRIYRAKTKKAVKRELDGFFNMAQWTGLEPATPGVTGRYSNQLNYHCAIGMFKSGG